MDELLQQIKHAAGQQAEPYRPFVYGHIASYDPALHRVRCIIPSLRDDADNPVLSGWMPLNSAWVGAGFGFQIAPLGGATQQTPTTGEKVKISIIERTLGVTVAATLCFDQINTPPFPAMNPGEMGFKHKTGSILYMNQDGDILVNPFRDLIMTAGRNVMISAPGGVATLQGQNLVVHGTVSAAFDADGCGFLYKATTIDNYVIGATSASHLIDPPQIPSS